ncbi:MAG TPA: EpsI family protein [Acidiferrobacterales bacterium]|nr:EpsI family protein [Acidiferrobacterales bacterium]
MNSVTRYIAIGTAMLTAAAAAAFFEPAKFDMAPKAELERAVPIRFGEWKEVKGTAIQMDLAPRRDETTPDPSNPYDETVLRTYARSDGATVMLALAWGARQRQEVKIHRPELCYVAQGFEVSGRTRASLALQDGSRIDAIRIVARSQSRIEPVTYWIRIGSEITANAWQSRVAILREGLQGRVADGILVRVSQALPLNGADLAPSYAVQEEFLKDLVAALEPTRVALLVGSQT